MRWSTLSSNDCKMAGAHCTAFCSNATSFRSSLSPLAAMSKSSLNSPGPGSNLHNMARRNLYWRALKKKPDGCPDLTKFATHEYDTAFLKSLDEIQGLRMMGIQTSELLRLKSSLLHRVSALDGSCRACSSLLSGPAMFSAVKAGTAHFYQIFCLC